MNIAASVNRTIDRAPTGRIFGYELFPQYRESPGAVVRAVNRSVETRRLERVEKGRFYKPRKGALGDVPVSDEERLRDALYRNGRRVGYVTGPALYNRLGLTTQMPKTVAIAVNRATQAKDLGTIRMKLLSRRAPISESTVPLLEILDILRDARKVPDANVERVIQENDEAFDGAHAGRAEETAAVCARLLQPGHASPAGNAADALPDGGVADAQGFAQSHHPFRPGHRPGRRWPESRAWNIR